MPSCSLVHASPSPSHHPLTISPAHPHCLPRTVSHTHHLPLTWRPSHCSPPPWPHATSSHAPPLTPHLVSPPPLPSYHADPHTVSHARCPAHCRHRLAPALAITPPWPWPSPSRCLAILRTHPHCPPCAVLHVRRPAHRRPHPAALAPPPSPALAVPLVPFSPSRARALTVHLAPSCTRALAAPLAPSRTRATLVPPPTCTGQRSLLHYVVTTHCRIEGTY